MIRFIHTADIHFGMENYGKVDPQTGIHTRLLDFYHALKFCIDTAIEHKIDFFLFSGDAYKTSHPTPTQQKLLLKLFLRLHEAKIPLIIVVGNHDNPLSFGRANSLELFGDLPLDGFHVIAKPTSFTLETAHGPIQIVGIPWPTRNSVALSEKHLHKSAIEITQYISQAVVHIVSDMASALNPDIPAILAGHLTVANGIFSGSEKRAIYGTDPIFLTSQLAIAPFDYVGLGHLHRHQNLNPNGYPAVVYSGSIERVDFGERSEQKGFCLVTIASKDNTSYEFIPTPSRPFIQIEITLVEGKPQTEQIIASLQQHSITDAVVKIIYHLQPGQKDTVDLKAVQQACADAMYLVGIIPVRPQTIRERRIGTAKLSSELPVQLSSYFDSKPELKQKKEALMQKALALLESHQQGQSEDQQ